MSTTNFDEIISLTNAIEAEHKRQNEAIEIANTSMKDAAIEVNDLIHYIKGLSEKPLTQGERVTIDKLRGIFKILNEASIEIKFKAN